MDDETLKTLRKIREIDEFEAISDLTEAERAYQSAIEEFEQAVEALRDFEKRLSEQAADGVNRSDLLLMRRQRERLEKEVAEARRKVNRLEAERDRAQKERLEANHEMQRQQRLEDRNDKQKRKKKRLDRQRLLDDLASRNDPTTDDFE